MLSHYGSGGVMQDNIENVFLAAELINLMPEMGDIFRSNCFFIAGAQNFPHLDKMLLKHLFGQCVEILYQDIG